MNAGDEGPPLVTIALPAWNSATTLHRTLASVLRQTFPSWELLVMDDGSSDDTVRMARDTRDPRVRVHADGRHAGLATRLNQAIDLARGRYFARMDADDIAYPQRLQTQLAFLEAHPDVDLVAARALAFRGNGQAIGLLPFRGTHEAICARPWSGIPMPHPTWFGRIEWFRRHRYAVPDALRAEDQELLIRALPGSRYAACPEILLGYRQGAYSVTRLLKGRYGRARAYARNALPRGEWLGLAACTGVTLLKAGIDVLAAMPGCDALFFRRMGRMPDAADLQDWNALWSRLGTA